MRATNFGPYMSQNLAGSGGKRPIRLVSEEG